MDTREITKYILVSAFTPEKLQKKVNEFRKKGYVEVGNLAVRFGKLYQPMTGLVKEPCITKESLRADIESFSDFNRMYLHCMKNDRDSIERRHRILDRKSKAINNFINQIWIWLKDDIKNQEER